MVTMASSLLPTAASASLSAILSSQIIPYTTKLQPLPECKGEIDYEVIEAWIYSVDNYFPLTSLIDPSQWAHLAANLM